MAKKLKRREITMNGKTMFKDEIDETFKMWNLNGDDYVDAEEVCFNCRSGRKMYNFYLI